MEERKLGGRGSSHRRSSRSVEKTPAGFSWLSCCSSSAMDDVPLYQVAKPQSYAVQKRVQQRERSKGKKLRDSSGKYKDVPVKKVQFKMNDSEASFNHQYNHLEQSWKRTNQHSKTTYPTRRLQDERPYNQRRDSPPPRQQYKKYDNRFQQDSEEERSEREFTFKENSYHEREDSQQEFYQ